MVNWAKLVKGNGCWEMGGITIAKVMGGEGWLIL